MKTKKIPMRLCLGCNVAKPKKEMIRVVRDKDGEISLDTTGKKSGRGAYICRNAECFKAARLKRRFEKSFSCAISDEVYDRMEEELLND